MQPFLKGPVSPLLLVPPPPLFSNDKSPSFRNTGYRLPMGPIPFPPLLDHRERQPALPTDSFLALCLFTSRVLGDYAPPLFFFKPAYKSASPPHAHSFYERAYVYPFQSSLGKGDVVLFPSQTSEERFSPPHRTPTSFSRL